MIITGSCHCRDITFTLAWPDDAPQIVARACDCSFCAKQGGAWMSNRDARLTVTLRHPEAVSRYGFGSRTAEFQVCARCGVVPVVISDLAGHLHAVVNVNTVDHPEALRITRQAAHFEGEDTGARLERRRRHWIADVTLAVAASC